MIFELRRCRGAAGVVVRVERRRRETRAELISGEASAEKMFRGERWRTELIPQAWPFELSGEAVRRGLSEEHGETSTERR